MRKILFFILLTLSFSGFAQDTIKPAYDQALQDRQLLYDNYTAAKSSFDSSETAMRDMIAKMEQVILSDDKLIQETLVAETDRADSLANKVTDMEKAQSTATVDAAKANLMFLIAAGAAGLFLILFVVVLVLMLTKGKKTKKAAAQLKEKEEELALVATRMEETKNEYKQQIDQLNGTLEETKSKAEKDLKNFQMKESEYKSHLTLVEDKINKASQKESELNYQVFQLELKLKNELETTIAQKCALENKVVELERELSETRLRVNEAQQPQVNVQELENRIAGLEWELSEARQKLSEVPVVPQGDLQELHNRIEDLERELAEARLSQEVEQPAPFMAGQELIDLRAKVDWYVGEAEYFRGVISNLEKEKEDLLHEVETLKGHAAEAEQLRMRIDELKQFLDHFRQE